MEGSAFTPISAFLGYAMKRPIFVKAESKESLALTISSVIRLSLVDPHLFGHMRLNVSQWQMLDLSAKLSTIASQETFVGN